MANNLFLISLLITLFLHNSVSKGQQPTAPPPTPPQLNATCNGVFLSYAYTGGRPIPPNDTANQPYRFESTVTVLNNGLDELKSWKVFVGFKHNELLVSATNAILADGTSLPAGVGNGTVFAGFPQTDLKSAVETAGDVTQMEVRIQLVGTQFGVRDPDVPMPDNITLANDGYFCPGPSKQGNNEIYTCCVKDSGSRSNVTVADELLPRQDGDLVIMYDVISTYDTNYWAQVSISNHNPLGRLENWKLSWDWMMDEFIFSMKGAYPYLVDAGDCLYGTQGQYYKDMDLSTVLNCERSPTIIDLPPTVANDTNIGRIPNCCRNGTILPPSMDPTRSTSVFQMQVFKMPPNLNRTLLIPPQNFRINGTMSSDYQCASPVRVNPSQFPDPSGLPSKEAAIASWQVVCNITHSKAESPKCCVSFSAFFNDSVVPCRTCACGCSTPPPSQSCNVNAPALLLPSQALLVPFENRTDEALSWADIKRWNVPNPLPCADNCGVSINWHLYTDHSGGWTARITLFNWGEINFADWFAAVQLDKAIPGFEEVYSFNGTALPGSNNTIFMQGRPGLNYLLAETDGANPKKDPPVPGMQQSVISFTKKNTPGINIAGGDGFPTKVLFNGEECALPTTLPTSNGHRLNAAAMVFGLLTTLAILLMQ